MCHVAPAPAFSFSWADSALPPSFPEFVGGRSNEGWFKGPPRFEWYRGGALAEGPIMMIIIPFVIIYVSASVVSGEGLCGGASQ